MAKYKLKNDRLWQWDSGQYVEVPADYTTCESQFYSSNYKEGLTVTTSSYVTEGTKVYCPIPNQLLTDSVDIVIYAYSRGTGTTHTETATVINVMERLKPNDYAYTPTEVQTFASLKADVEEAVATVEGYEDRLEDVEETLPTKLSDAPSDNKQYARKNGAWAEVQGGSGGTVEWDNIQNKPSTFPPSSHNQAWSTITDKPSTYPPEEHNQGWSTITDKPETYPPSSHTHDDRYYTTTETNTLLGAKANASDVYSKTAADGRFALLSAITDMATKTWVNAQGFITSLAGYATEAWVEAKGYLTSVGWNDVQNKPSTFTPSSHTHTKSEVTDFPTNVSSFTNDAGYLTSHQDIGGKENTSNKVTSISSSSTDTQYPSAKCVYDTVGNIEATLQAIRGV